MKKLIKNLKKFTFNLVVFYFAIKFILRKYFGSRTGKKERRIGILVGEFFHKELFGFGGYGKSAKNITDYFNTKNNSLKIDVLLSTPLNDSYPKIEHYHNADVISRPNFRHKNKYLINFIKYAKKCSLRNFDLLLSIDYYDQYEYSLSALPRTPLIIWIHDPQSEKELNKISTVSLEILACRKNKPEELLKFAQNEREAMEKFIKSNKIFNRKVMFATPAHCLTERFKRLFNLSEIDPVFLPNPISIPSITKITHSSKPSFLFLARLDPRKRPWIYFELARRFKKVDFFVAGITHYPQIMNKVIQKYSNVPNLKFLNLVLDRTKEDLLKNIWAVVNTSIHEGLPVSFLETFSFYKPVISCVNPDNLVDRFGIYTGEILGDGFDKHTIDVFSNAVDRFLCNPSEIFEKGIAGRQYVEKIYSFSNFEEVLNKLTATLVK